MKDHPKLDPLVIRSIHAEVLHSVNVTRIQACVGRIAPTNLILEGTRSLVVHGGGEIIFDEVSAVKDSRSGLIALLGAKDCFRIK